MTLRSLPSPILLLDFNLQQMGGHAFTADHPDAYFPRMPIFVYSELKAKLHKALGGLFEHVATPAEAPEKADYGDIDFIVCSPADVAHEQIHDALKATWSIPKKGTSNFALSWDAVVGPEEGRPNDYIQVDVCICQDVAEFERVRFCHSYGDLFMILGLMARSHGLTLGTGGLRVSDSCVYRTTCSDTDRMQLSSLTVVGKVFTYISTHLLPSIILVSFDPVLHGTVHGQMGR